MDDKVWFKITTPEERKALQPGLVFQEVLSYLKGSAEAVSSDAGWLSLEQYLEASARIYNHNRTWHLLITVWQLSHKDCSSAGRPLATCTWALDSFK